MSAAANAILKVKPSDLNDKAREIGDEIQNMDNCMNNIQSTMQAVTSSAWQSTSGDNFIGRVNTLMTEIQESLTNLGFYVNDLKDAAGKYEEVEGQINSAVENLNDPSSIFNV